jgi:dUTP pyrophosphatase
MMKFPVIQVCRLKPESDGDIPLPQYMTPHSSGMDISAGVKEDVVIAPGEIVLIPTGYAIAIPQGFEVQVRPRSGLAVKHGIGLINSPGTIDSDYRGEVKIAIINHGSKPFTIKRGDRIAQLVVQRIYQADVKLAERLDRTSRDTGGFGHTGVATE